MQNLNNQKILRAVKFASKTHDVYQKQKRKGKDVAYISHPLAVGIILAHVGADEDVVVAGILHDTIEDSIPEKQVTYEMLEERFGERVAKMVWDVSETDKDLSWEERKKEALKDIESFPRDSLMVKSADVVSNLSELIDDYKRCGDKVFEMFTAPKERKIESSLEVIDALIRKWTENPFTKELKYLKSELEIIKEDK